MVKLHSISKLSIVGILKSNNEKLVYSLNFDLGGIVWSYMIRKRGLCGHWVTSFSPSVQIMVAEKSVDDSLTKLITRACLSK
jgi:hypothetical protein